MSKVDILRLDSVTTNDTKATALINTNFQNIQSVIETLLSRTGVTPNYMDAILDMNSYRIINTAAPTEDFDVVNLKYLRDYVGNLETLVSDATEAAQAALAQAQNAASSSNIAASAAQTALEARDAATNAAITVEGIKEEVENIAESIEGIADDPNVIAVGEDLRDPNSAIKGAKDAAESAQASAEAADNSATAANTSAIRAESAKDLAVAAAETFANSHYATNLQYSNNFLQLLDQHGDALGDAVEIVGGGGGSGSGTVFIATNISVDELDFVEDDTYEQYPYKVTETIAGVTTDMTCLVTLPVNIATSGLIAPVALVGDGEITLWSKEIIEETFVIPTITFFASGDE